MKHYIFGYGSLVNQEALTRYLCRPCAMDEVVFCHLKGYRRCWNVAMDNQVDLPAYKYYLDAITGERPPIFVTFLNIRPQQHTLVSGTLFEVSPEELSKLDRRERNYQRMEVSTQLDIPILGGKVWVYIGTTEAKSRYQAGVSNNTACISEEYYQFVHDCFGQCSDTIAIKFKETTDAPAVPLRKLVRIDTV